MGALWKLDDDSTLMEMALRRNAAFEHWPAALLAELIAASRLGRYPRAARIGPAESGVCETCVIVSGRLLLVRPFDGPHEEVVGLMGANMVFGELMHGTVAAHALDCVAFEKAVVIHMASSKLCQLLDREPARWMDFSRMLLAMEATLLHTLIGQATGPVAQRVAHTLQQYAVLYGMRGREDRQTTLRMSQDDIGALLHLSRKSIGKALRTLEDLGLVVCGYNAIVVHDIQALGAFTGAWLARPAAAATG